MEKEDVLWENEIKANKVLVVACFAAVATFSVIWLLSSLGVFYVYGLGRSNLVFFTIVFVPLIAALISIKLKHEKKWIKYMLMASMMFACALVDVVFTYNVPLLMVVPIVLSSRYFYKMYTVRITICTFILFLVSAILGVYYGAVDVNSLELPKGTVFSMGEETWLSDVVEMGMVSYDKELMLFNTLFYAYFVKLLQALIIAAACIVMSKQGRDMVFKQKEMTEKATRVSTELDLARKIQADILQTRFPAFPDRKEFDLYASMDPAREVGGDFYDMFMVDEDHLCLVMADVSGKGIPAAMFMMASKNIISSHVKFGMSPSEALGKSNESICSNNNEDMFVTVWLGILQISTGRLTASNAGHEYPILKRANNSFELYKDKHGAPLGMFDDTEYTEYELQLEPGDKLFVYTDGVPEATRADEEMFGLERTLEALNSAANATSRELLEQVRKSVDEFVGDAEQFDDLTMLAIEYIGVKE